MASRRYQSALRSNLVFGAKRFTGGERPAFSLGAHSHVDGTFQGLPLGVSATVPHRRTSAVFVEGRPQIIPLLP